MTSAEVLLLYGTEKGNARSICEDLEKAAAAQGYRTKMDQLNNYEAAGFLQHPGVTIIVCSTTGEGEPPETARKFWRWLKKKTHPPDLLAHLRYTILGLGDTNYSKFCSGAKLIDSRLHEVGAAPFYSNGYADDGVGLEEVVEPWRTGLWPAVKVALAVAGGNPSEPPAQRAAPRPLPACGCLGIHR